LILESQKYRILPYKLLKNKIISPIRKVIPELDFVVLRKNFHASLF